jgi:hypothetical protein
MSRTWFITGTSSGFGRAERPRPPSRLSGDPPTRQGSARFRDGPAALETLSQPDRHPRDDPGGAGERNWEEGSMTIIRQATTPAPHSALLLDGSKLLA